MNKIHTAASGSLNPNRLLQFALSCAPPLLLEAGVKHGVFDRLNVAPMTTEELSAATGCSARGLRTLLNALVGLEFLGVNRDRRYSLTPESAAFLVSGTPEFMGGCFKHISTLLVPAWLELSEVVRTGKPVIKINQEGEGASVFHEFVEDTFPLSYQMAKQLAAELKLSVIDSCISALDLAAGSGVWGILLAQASPRVSVTAVDWAGVLDVTRRMAQKCGVLDQFQFVAGDLLKVNFGTGYQVATLGHILHSEGAERSQVLLRKTFEALAPGGTIAIQEFLVNAERTGPLDALIFAVNMLVKTQHGDTFSFEEISSWLHNAGFADARLLEGPGPAPLILATRR